MRKKSDAELQGQDYIAGTLDISAAVRAYQVKLVIEKCGLKFLMNLPEIRKERKKV